MKKENWLIVANSSLARIFKINNGRELAEVIILEHPESRLHNLDLVSDKPGRNYESAGVSRHAYEPKVLPKRHEFAVFAKTIADYLSIHYNDEVFDSLYIAANPALLGLLRQELHANIARAIKEEIDKDLTHVKTEEILSHFPSLFLRTAKV